ncbi:hypothetical protein PsorP6_007819 [Peronosclerospora sorghi]|uniref:Uncharacterized protein n=1 Tax=Peronosclerospora sorghi TaxID=230839 RepID=A0ACC0W9C8_9STRA|nr:hypothetical protein PsorP6_007819 [Peronosclerospora sorghi]
MLGGGEIINTVLCMREVKVEGIILYSYRASAGELFSLDKSKFKGESARTGFDMISIVGRVNSSLSRRRDVVSPPLR